MTMKSGQVAMLLVLAQICCVATRNVLILLGDDVGFQFGAYGNTKIKSPHVDDLAQTSMLFKNGFTSVSSCSPSRSVVLTGLPQHQNGMYGLHNEVHHFQTFDDVMSLPVILRNNQVHTGIIGKKHVGPDSVYSFDYEATEEEYDLNQVGRNITFMREKMREFFRNASRPFLLYMGIHDIHRCPYQSPLGEFCEKFGDGVSPGTGVIPDWKPEVYDPADVEVPYYLPDTLATRRDLANMYKTYSRFDQGIGLFLDELHAAGFSDDTMVIFTSDNGIPFPLAKTNLYDPGQGEPLMISSPYHKVNWGKKTDAMASTMDIVPTVLDYFGIPFPDYTLFGQKVVLTGKSLIGALGESSFKSSDVYDHVFSSHNFHEVAMNYPMRVYRTLDMKLIHNLNFPAPYPMAVDIFLSPTFSDILNRTVAGKPLPWITTLDKYYYRDEWQLFNLTSDPEERVNLAGDIFHKQILAEMQMVLGKWQTETADPWRCLPSGVLNAGTCYPMHNEHVLQ